MATENKDLQNPVEETPVAADENVPMEGGDTAPTEEPATDMPAEEPIPTKKDAFMSKMKEGYPDKNFETDDDMYEAASEMMDEVTKLRASNADSEEFKQSLAKAIEENPGLALLIQRTIETGNLRVALQDIVDDPNDLVLQEGEEGYDMAQERMNKRIAREQAQDEINAKWEANKDKIPQTLQAWSEAKGLNETELDNFVEFILSISERILTGDIDEDVLSQLYKSYTYDDKVGEVEEDKAIAENNAKPAKKSAPSMPMPANNAPSPKTTLPKEDSFESVFTK